MYGNKTSIICKLKIIMVENLLKYSCGQCGNDTYKIYTQEKISNLFTECIECHSITEIVITQPTFKLKWFDDSKGIMCL